jgi:hypothetical protein
MIDWSVVHDEAPQDSQEVRDMVTELEVALARSGLAERAAAVLAQVLAPPLGDATFDRVQSGLGTLFGLGEEEPGRMFAWLAFDPTRARLEAFVAAAPPAVARFLRDVWAALGDDLAKAYRCWRELPDDWEVVHREINHNVLTEQVRIELRITKFNGEQAQIAGDAGSILSLTTNFVRSLNMVGHGLTIPEPALTDFREQVAMLEALLAEAVPAATEPEPAEPAEPA